MMVDLLQFIVFVAFFLPSEVAITLHAGGFTTVPCFCSGYE
jgi:hypothetical protein